MIGNVGSYVYYLLFRGFLKNFTRTFCALVCSYNDPYTGKMLTENSPRIENCLSKRRNYCKLLAVFFLLASQLWSSLFSFQKFSKLSRLNRKGYIKQEANCSPVPFRFVDILRKCTCAWDAAISGFPSAFCKKMLQNKDPLGPLSHLRLELVFIAAIM